MTEGRCTSGSTSEWPSVWSCSEITEWFRGGRKTRSSRAGKMSEVVQINTLQRRFCTVIQSAMHPRNKEQSSTVVSFDLQLSAPPLAMIWIKHFAGRFLFHIKSQENGCMTEMLCWDSGNKSSEIQLNQMFGRCLFPACLHFPDYPQATERAPALMLAKHSDQGKKHHRAAK